ncbi:MAG: hypothetical protein FRX49_07065 [Trebouxia sp. A1-2]|nr:MAG: hypothetical protein FRX49_07065 [Trebouxia sp. A1-2]
MQLSHAVLLAGGVSKQLHPLTSAGTPKALVPVGNQALISFPLKTLEQGGVTHTFVVVEGEAATSKVSHWISKNYGGKMHVEVRSVTEDSSSAAAVAQLKDDLKADSFIVLSGDLVSDVPLKALAASHYVTEATVTVLLKEKRISPASETKPGKAPKNVDYIGLDTQQKQLTFIAGSTPEARRQVRVPLAALQDGRLSLRTDLMDAHLYIFHKHTFFKALEARPAYESIRQDLLPYMVRQQHSRHPFSSKQDSNHQPPSPSASQRLQQSDSLTPGSQLVDVISSVSKGTGVSGHRNMWDLTSFDLASRLLTEKPNSRFENFVHESVQLGSKATVSAGCIVAKGNVLGDRCSVKRSIIGTTCKLGNSVKIVSSIVMDDVIVEEGSHIQNSIICSGSHVQARCSVRDCKVGPGFKLSEGSEYRDEVLSKAKVPQ